MKAAPHHDGSRWECVVGKPRNTGEAEMFDYLRLNRFGGTDKPLAFWGIQPIRWPWRLSHQSLSLNSLRAFPRKRGDGWICPQKNVAATLGTSSLFQAREHDWGKAHGWEQVMSQRSISHHIIHKKLHRKRIAMLSIVPDHWIIFNYKTGIPVIEKSPSGIKFPQTWAPFTGEETMDTRM